MDYQTLTDVLGQSKMGAAPAPSLSSIIQGIQSQYQPVQTMPVQSGLYGANRFISGSPQFGAIEQVPEFGRLNQLAGPSFVPSAFDKSLYEKVDTQKLSDLISQIDSGNGNGDFGSNSFSIDDAGLASSSNIGTMGVTGLAMALGAVSGLPAGMLASIVGKQNIANAINAQSHAQAAAFNNALVAEQMGLTNSPANAAALASAIDSLSAANASTAAATTGVSGTGAAAAQAAQDAMSYALEQGLSVAQAAQVAQDAANAVVAAQGKTAANPADFGAIGFGGNGFGIGGPGGPGSTSAANASDFGAVDSGTGGGGYGGGDTSGGYGGDAGYGA
jgi:hypothetical protein